MNRFIEECKRILAINSITENGNEELVNYLSILMQERGLEVKIQHIQHSIEGVSKRQFNILGVLGDPLVEKKIRKGLLLTGHLDTVGFGIANQWTQTAGNPFNPVIKDGILYGLGASLPKLDFLCKVYAVSRFRERKIRMPIYLAGTSGGERGMFGTRYLIQSQVFNPSYTMVGSPVDHKVVYKHKSVASYKVSINFQMVERDARGFNRRANLFTYGKSAHSAYPGQGSNAILKMMSFLKRAIQNGFEIQFSSFQGGNTPNQVPDFAVTEFFLTSHQFEDFKRYYRELVRMEGWEKDFHLEMGGLGERGVALLPEAVFTCLCDILETVGKKVESFKLAGIDDEFDPSGPSFVPGKIVYSRSKIEIYFDIRVAPEKSSKEIDFAFKKVIEEFSQKYPSLNINLQKERASVGLNYRQDQDFLRICGEAMEEAGLTPNTGTSSVCSEAGAFVEAGHTALAFGVGDAKSFSHAPNEGVSLESLHRSMVFYEKLIKKVCT